MTVVVFRSRLSSDPEVQQEYGREAARMLELAPNTPGFISVKTFAAPDGERVTIVEYESDEAVAAWRENPEHVQAQIHGREKYYDEFKLQTCEVIRCQTFKRKK